jgi:hypothetical protein
VADPELRSRREPERNDLSTDPGTQCDEGFPSDRSLRSNHAASAAVAQGAIGVTRRPSWAVWTRTYDLGIKSPPGMDAGGCWEPKVPATSQHSGCKNLQRAEVCGDEPVLPVVLACARSKRARAAGIGASSKPGFSSISYRRVPVAGGLG